jgi:hypothetical protein
MYQRNVYRTNIFLSVTVLKHKLLENSLSEGSITSGRMMTHFLTSFPSLKFNGMLTVSPGRRTSTTRYVKTRVEETGNSNFPHESSEGG